MSANARLIRCWSCSGCVVLLSFMTIFDDGFVGVRVRCVFVVWPSVFVAGGFRVGCGYRSPIDGWLRLFWGTMWGQVGGGPRGLDVNHFLDVSLALCVPHNFGLCVPSFPAGDTSTPQ